MTEEVKKTTRRKKASGLLAESQIILREAVSDNNKLDMLQGAHLNRSVKCVIHMLDEFALAGVQEATARGIPSEERMMALGSSQGLIEFRLELEETIRRANPDADWGRNG